MDKELYEKARMIKCKIKDLNENLDMIERLRKKYKGDIDLDITLQNYHAMLFNDIQNLERDFALL